MIRSEPALHSDAGIQAAVRAHAGELFGFARRALDDSAAAEDAVQETFVRAWRASGRFDPSLGSLRAWLFAILRNVIIDAARARQVRSNVVSAEVDVAEDDRVEEVLRSWLVEEALRRLTPEHRHAVREVYFNGRPATEVAADVGVPAATVRTRLFYALKALRLSLDELGWDDA
jgi:RNA polymerase sigma-70 factor (ECF subfamily)